MRRKLSETETAKRAEELAEGVAALAKLRAEAKEAAKQWRARIDALERRVDGLALSVRLKSDEAEQQALDLVTGEVGP